MVLARAFGINKRGRIFFWLTLGLLQEQLGQSQNALKYFEFVEAGLSKLEKEDKVRYGADLVNFLIGQQYFRNIADDIDGNEFELEKLDLTLFDKAVQHFQDAASLGGQHQHRGEKGIGDVWSYLGTLGQKEFYDQRLGDEEIIVLPEQYTNAADLIPQLLKHRQNLAQALDRAAAHYEKTAEHASQLDDPYVTLILDYAMARAMWAEGQLLYIVDAYDEAIPKIEAFVQTTEKGDESILARVEAQRDVRLIVNAYHMLGVAHLQLADMTRETGKTGEKIALLELAWQHFQTCISTGKEVAHDSFIKNELLADNCQPKLDITQIAIQDAQAHAGE